MLVAVSVSEGTSEDIIEPDAGEAADETMGLSDHDSANESDDASRCTFDVNAAIAEPQSCGAYVRAIYEHMRTLEHDQGKSCDSIDQLPILQCKRSTL